MLAAITGAVFDDANFSFRKDAEESFVGSRLVYIDANDNASLDNGERFVVAEEDGSFAFSDLDDGDYVLRLFNGTQTQQQTTPVAASIDGDTISVDADSRQLLLGDGPAIVLTSDTVVIGDLQSGTSSGITVGSNLTKMQRLPDGKLLVIGSDESGDTAWIVDPVGESVTPINLAGTSEPIQWSDIAIDGDGHGVLVEQSDDAVSTVHAIDATDPSGGFGISAATTVQTGTQVLTSETGSRTVFATADSEGMQLSLWSNSTATLITDTPINVAGTSEMVAYDDAAGLLVLRTFDGGISIHDVNQDFATLHTLSDVTGPIAIDSVRDLLMTVSPIDAMLRMIDIRDGALIADLAIDLSTVGQVASMAIGERPDAFVILGAAGVTEVALTKSAHRVTVAGGEDVDAVLFGVAIDGENDAPRYVTLPELSTREDTTLVKAAPAALQGSGDSDGAVDAQEDDFVLIQTGQAANGVASVSIDGAITYTPNDDFFGQDTVPVILHDGRDVSSVFNLKINVTPVSDPPIDIEVQSDPIPEHIRPIAPVADIEVIDVDLERNHLIVVHDGRFEARDGQIIFVHGELDFESEPVIFVSVSITDLDTDTTLERTITLRVADENDPITDIKPGDGEVSENVFGDIAVELEVDDQDVGQTHEFSVDDDRFVMDGAKLRLADDVAVNFEETPEIIVNVTANDGAGSSFTKEIIVKVLDIGEQHQGLSLSNDTVMELEPGDVVGSVNVDEAPPNARLVLTVDDPRFEIDGNTLQLIEDQFVERAAQEEIQLQITVEDSQGEFASISETFVILVLENDTPYHNDNNPYDVDHSGDVTSLDALLVINYLNTYGPGPVGHGDPGYGYDVNSDGFVTALDALLILNELNRIRGTGGTVGTGEGEQVDAQDDVSSNDEETSDGQSDLPGVINGLTVGERKLGDAVASDRDTGGRGPGPAAQVFESPSEPSTQQQFAENVDHTLRLLSGQSE